MSIHREIVKNPIFKINGNFSKKMRLFKIPVKPPILQSLKSLLFSLFAISRTLKMNFAIMVFI